MIERGQTPVLPKTQLAELGFQLILYPLAGLYASAHALQGTTAGDEDRLIAFEQFNDLIGVDERYALAERFGEGS